MCKINLHTPRLCISRPCTSLLHKGSSVPWRPPTLVSPRAHSSLHHASDVVREPHIKVNSFFRWYVHLLLLSHQHEVVGEIFFFFPNSQACLLDPCASSGLHGTAWPLSSTKGGKITVLPLFYTKSRDSFKISETQKIGKILPSPHPILIE